MIKTVDYRTADAGFLAQAPPQGLDTGQGIWRRGFRFCVL